MSDELLEEIKRRHMDTEWFGIPPVEESLDAHGDREFLLEEVDRLRAELATAKADAWDEGAQSAWESTCEGWNHEYAGGNDAHPEFPEPHMNPYREANL